MSTISILHTTARPHRWHEAYEAWMPECDEYVLTCEKEYFGDEPEPAGHKLVSCRSEGGVNAGFNLAAEISTGDILVVGADDLFPTPHLSALIRQFVPDPSLPRVVWASTGCWNDYRYILHPILTRAYLEQRRWLFRPDLFCFGDVEFSDSAKADGVVIDARRYLRLDHRHYSLGYPGFDALNAAMNARSPE